MTIHFRIQLSLFALVFSSLLFGQNFSNGFPFALPVDDNTSSVFLPAFPASPITEAKRVVPEGRQFVRQGEAIRFWGVNITSSACFPTHTEAETIARRLRKMGINLVRFHHLDNPAWAGNEGTIFLNSQDNTLQIDPVSMDRLNYFISRLKQEGVYVNLNLHVTRTFRLNDGVPLADSIADFGKVVTLYDPQLQALQKEYANELLAQVNPYTGITLALDPVVVMVEMNNENSIYGWWKSNALRPFNQGGRLTVYHHEMLNDRWHTFLGQEYADDESLAASWNNGTIPAGTEENLTNPDLEEGLLQAPWLLETHDIAQANITLDNTNPQSGNQCVALQVTQATGTEWHIQFKQNDLNFQRDSTYELRFWARTDTERDFSISFLRDDAPYTWYSGRTFTANTQWQEFRLLFTASESTTAGRLSISPLGGNGTYWFDNFSLSNPAVDGLLPGESLNTASIKRIPWSQRLSYTPARVADLSRFYVALQAEHFREMKEYLTDQLLVSAAITGTNALVGPADVVHQLDLDYLDDHSYWDHPHFPNTAWDSYDWLINNQPQVLDPNFEAITHAFSGLARTDQPFTLSEYNHGAPNRYRVEMPHSILAYAAFQGADGIMFYTYAGERNQDNDLVNNFFDLHRDHSIMAQFPGVAMAYRRGYLQEAQQPLMANYKEEDIHRFPIVDNQGRWGRYTPYDKRLILTTGVQTGSYDAPQTSNFTEWPSPPEEVFTTFNGETTLNTTEGLLTTNTDKFCSVTGFFSTATDMTLDALTINSGNDFGTLQWISLDDQPLPEAKKSLITLTAAQQNTNMTWNGTNTIHNNWGNAPTEQKPLQVAIEMALNADYIKLYPLDVYATPTDSILVLPNSQGHFPILLDQYQYETLWFGINTFIGPVSTLESDQPTPFHFYPNPVLSGQPVQITGPEKSTILLFNILGQLVNQQEINTPFYRLDTTGLTAGTYQLVFLNENRQRLNNTLLIIK